MHACMVFSFNYYSAEHYTVIPIWLTIDVYRMTKVNSTMTSREYMISQPPINQCSSLGGTWICMSIYNVSWICNSILSLGYRDLLVKKEKDHLRYFKVAINMLSQESQEKNGNRLHVLDINYKDDTVDSTLFSRDLKQKCRTADISTRIKLGRNLQYIY